MSNDDELTKAAVKEAVTEWLDAQKKAAYEGLGKWLINKFLILLVGAMIIFILYMNGIKYKQ